MGSKTCSVSIRGTNCVGELRANSSLCEFHYDQSTRGRLYSWPTYRHGYTGPKPPDVDGERWCIRCAQWLPIASYGSGNRVCKACRRDDVLVQRWGMTAHAIAQRAEAQGGCAICSNGPGAKGWCVDHDHGCCPGGQSCGACIRGILCGSCNLMLGLARDDTTILSAAVRYLGEC